MPVFAVLYDYADNSEEPRNVHRAAHREFLRTLTGPVKALATGPFAAAPAGALLVVGGLRSGGREGAGPGPVLPQRARQPPSGPGMDPGPRPLGRLTHLALTSSDR